MDDKRTEDPIVPTEETDNPNLSTEHQRTGDARFVSDTLDRGQPPADETIPRKSKLL